MRRPGSRRGRGGGSGEGDGGRQGGACPGCRGPQMARRRLLWSVGVEARKALTSEQPMCSERCRAWRPTARPPLVQLPPSRDLPLEPISPCAATLGALYVTRRRSAWRRAHAPLALATFLTSGPTSRCEPDLHPSSYVREGRQTGRRLPSLFCEVRRKRASPLPESLTRRTIASRDEIFPK